MTHHEEDELSPDYRTGDAPDEPLEQDRDDVADQIEEAVTEARSADPRVSEPPGA
jgi:outer membrane murein-binding lipoprotein Lpp